MPKRSSGNPVASKISFAFWNESGVISLGFGVLIVWIAYQYLPEVREIIRTVPDVWDSFTR